jgi:hypothetical protein
MNRPGYRVGQDVGALVPFTKTSLYSVLEDDRAAEALAYYFLSQETPHVAPKFETRWAAIMRPATDLVHRGRFAQKWEETNPWTAKSILGIREGVAALDDTAKD